jgi:ribosome-associated toxin RatA of RatAB toxin-antitoxin module
LKVLKFDGEIVGTEFKASPLGGKSFACRVISIIPDNEIKLNYFDGIYRGTGYWKIEGKDGNLKISYTVDLEIVDKSIAFLSRIISIPRLHSIIFRKILNNLERRITKE